MFYWQIFQTFWTFRETLNKFTPIKSRKLGEIMLLFLNKQLSKYITRKCKLKGVLEKNS